MSRNIKCPEITNVTKYQMSQNLKCHKISNVVKSQMSRNLKCHEISNVTKSQMSRNLKCQNCSNSSQKFKMAQTHLKSFNGRQGGILQSISGVSGASGGL